MEQKLAQASTALTEQQGRARDQHRAEQAAALQLVQAELQKQLAALGSDIALLQDGSKGAQRMQADHHSRLMALEAQDPASESRAVKA